MSATRAFSIVRELSRREVSRHQARFVGITASAPVHEDVNGLLSWVCDVRVGNNANWYLIRDCSIASWAIGLVSDMNVPVVCERSEAGRVTIIARSEVRLPDIVYTTYSAHDLDLDFITGLEADSGGTYYDGYGYAMTDPTTETGVSRTYTWTVYQIGWDDTSFEYGETSLDAVEQEWVES